MFRLQKKIPMKKALELLTQSGRRRRVNSLLENLIYVNDFSITNKFPISVAKRPMNKSSAKGKSLLSKKGSSFKIQYFQVLNFPFFQVLEFQNLMFTVQMFKFEHSKS